MEISVIVPIYNERDNLKMLYKELSLVMDSLNETYEIIFVDDGSLDHSLSVLEKIAVDDKHVKIIRFKKNYGLISAFDAGFRQTQGDFVLTIDADMQVRPSELKKVYAELKDYDAVVGWRNCRIKSDGFIKAISSMIANYIRRIFLGEEFRDSGCPIKGFRKYVIKDLVLYKSFEWFIFSLLKMKGYRIK